MFLSEKEQNSIIEVEQIIFRKRIVSDTVLTALIAAGIPALVTIVSAVVQHRSKRLTEVMKKNCDHMDEQFEGLRQEMKVEQKKDEQAITRLELMMLITHDPENVLEIEKLARKYFIDLEGDTYMSKMYSDYAKKYGADHAFVAHL